MRHGEEASSEAANVDPMGTFVRERVCSEGGMAGRADGSLSGRPVVREVVQTVVVM